MDGLIIVSTMIFNFGIKSSFTLFHSAICCYILYMYANTKKTEAKKNEKTLKNGTKAFFQKSGRFSYFILHVFSFVLVNALFFLIAVAGWFSFFVVRLIRLSCICICNVKRARQTEKERLSSASFSIDRDTVILWLLLNVMFEKVSRNRLLKSTICTNKHIQDNVFINAQRRLLYAVVCTLLYTENIQSRT